MKTTNEKETTKEIVAHKSKTHETTLEMTKVTKYIAIICLLIPHLFVLISMRSISLWRVSGDGRFNKITIKIVSFLIGFNNTAGTFVCVMCIPARSVSLRLRSCRCRSTNHFVSVPAQWKCSQRIHRQQERIRWFTEKLTSDFDQMKKTRDLQQRIGVYLSGDLFFLSIRVLSSSFVKIHKTESGENQQQEQIIK